MSDATMPGLDEPTPARSMEPPNLEVDGDQVEEVNSALRFHFQMIYPLMFSVGNRIKLEQSGLTAEPGHLFETVQKKYSKQLDIIAEESNETGSSKEKVKDHADATASCNRARLLRRHRSEWHKSIKSAVKAARDEESKYDDLLEDLPRSEDVPDFRTRFVQRAMQRRKRIVRAAGMAERLIKDLEAHPGEK